MAERRMFSKEIVDSDAFLDMPVSTQNLYFHLGMRADDDGFINSVNKIMAISNASKNDLELLIVKSFLIPFMDGVFVIKHWRMNNYIRGDRYKPTNYQEDYALLEIKRNGAYTLISPDTPVVYQKDTNGIPVVDAVKDRLGKNSIDNTDDAHEPEIPSLREVVEFVRIERLDLDPKRFWTYYEEMDWKIEGEPIASWRALAVSWTKPKRKKTLCNEGVISKYMSPKELNNVVRKIENINVEEEEM